MNLRRAGEDKGHEGPNVTPLVDFLLLLVLVYILCAQLGQDEHALATPPAVAAAGSVGRDARDVIVVVTPGGDYLIDREPVPGAQLETVLQDRCRKAPTAQLLLLGDARASWGAVATLISVC